MKKILITGGAGFIGHHLANKLISLNFKVNIIDNLSTGKKSNIPKKSFFFYGDVNNKKLLNKASKNCDVIIHLAACTELQKSIYKPEETLEDNLISTTNIIKICMKKKKKLIFASSCSVYDLNVSSKLVENKNINPKNPYAMSKYFSEELIRFYSDNFKLSYNILRFFNVYGSKQNSKGDYAAVMPKFINSAKQNGVLYLHNNGSQTRDFVHVKDIVKAIILAISTKKNFTINIGSGKSISIKSLAMMIVNKFNSGKIKKGLNLKSDAKFSCANLKNAKKYLNFEPSYNIKDYLNEFKKLKISLSPVVQV